MLGSNAAHTAVFRNSNTEVLLIQRQDILMWVLPGGHVDKGETFEQTAIREFEEETGYKVSIKKLLVVYINERPRFFKKIYLGDIISGKKYTGAETKNVAWFPVNKLPGLMSLYERSRIKEALLAQGSIIKRPLKFDLVSELLYQLKDPKNFFTLLLYGLGNRFKKIFYLHD